MLQHRRDNVDIPVPLVERLALEHVPISVQERGPEPVRQRPEHPDIALRVVRIVGRDRLHVMEIFLRVRDLAGFVVGLDEVFVFVELEGVVDKHILHPGVTDAARIRRGREWRVFDPRPAERAAESGDYTGLVSRELVNEDRGELFRLVLRGVVQVAEADDSAAKSVVEPELVIGQVPGAEPGGIPLLRPAAASSRELTTLELRESLTEDSDPYAPVTLGKPLHQQEHRDPAEDIALPTASSTAVQGESVLLDCLQELLLPLSRLNEIRDPDRAYRLRKLAPPGRHRHRLNCSGQFLRLEPDPAAVYHLVSGWHGA